MWKIYSLIMASIPIYRPPLIHLFSVDISYRQVDAPGVCQLEVNCEDPFCRIRGDIEFFQSIHLWYRSCDAIDRFSGWCSYRICTSCIWGQYTTNLCTVYSVVQDKVWSWAGWNTVDQPLVLRSWASIDRICGKVQRVGRTTSIRYTYWRNKNRVNSQDFYYLL